MIENTTNAKYKMILSTSQRLSSNSTYVSSLPTYTSIFTQFSTDFTQLQQVCEQLQVKKSSVSTTKQNLRYDMCNKALDIAVRIKAYAKLNANDALMEECSFSKSDFYYKKELDARNNAMVIYARANTNITALTAYGVTTTSVTALKTAIDSFSNAIPTTNFTRAEKKDLILKREKYMAACLASLIKIDALVEMLKVTQPTFYLQYKEARRIVKYTVTTSLIGLLQEADTGLNLSAVKIEVKSLDNLEEVASQATAETELIKKRTVGNGKFYIRNLVPGTYVLSFSKPGYQTKQETVTVNSGETSRISVELEKQVYK